MLWLVIGGANQGKSSFLHRRVAVTGVQEIDPVTDNDLTLASVAQKIAAFKSEQRVVLYHFHILLERHGGAVSEIMDQLIEWLCSVAVERDLYLEVRECGSGIVPLRKEDREQREQIGRFLTRAVAVADGVVRMFCGLPDVIKEPQWSDDILVADQGTVAFRLYLVRHGMTEYNQQRRYLGTGDMGINERGREELASLYEQGHFPPLDFLYSSPLQRCLDSAAVAWPDHPIDGLDSNFRERNFGEFEGLTYAELCTREDYRCWLDGEGRAAPPGGESGDSIERRVAFGLGELICRCLRVYRWHHWGWMPETVRGIPKNGELFHAVGLMCHGGVIMEIMRILGFTDFYAWQVTNGSWVRLQFYYNGELVDETPIVGGRSAGSGS
ncbi:MAG TPA: hypothetical protein GX717_03845 [Clostridiaceae bacterium]|nr:hypothetical protein [Clostridiaceae bacterium]